MQVGRICIVVALLCLAARCSAQAENDTCEPTSGLVVQEVHLTGSPSVGSDEAEAIGGSLVGACFSRNEGSGPLLRRLRDAFQARGFFNANISDLKVEVTNSLQRPSPVRVYAGIQAGPRYRVGRITFTGGRAVTNVDVLRQTIPLNAGDIFDAAKVREGIKNLHDLYGALGFLNFTPVPDTNIDDSRQTVDLALALDEGPQLFVAHVDIIAPPEVAERLIEAWPLKVSDVYNSRLVSWFFTNKDLLPPAASPERNMQTTQNNDLGTVSIRVDLCPLGRVCSAYVVPCRSDRVCLLK